MPDHPVHLHQALLRVQPGAAAVHAQRPAPGVIAPHLRIFGWAL